MLYHQDCPFCSIVPPYLLEKYAQSTDSRVRERAAATIQQLRRARTLRNAMAQTLNLAPAPLVAPVKMRRIFDCQGSSDLSRLPPAMIEGGARSSDVAVQEAYDYSGITWDFFQEEFGRNSIDDRASTMVSSVHYSENGRGYDNAIWNGSQMIYGDGGEIFGRMTQCLDVVAHELAHGVTQFSAGLPYENQAGALNEHFSDVFGVLVRQRHENQTDPASANWLVGDKLMLTGEALRSLKDPGTANEDDPQPAHMQDYQQLPNTYAGDWGGVHINSGIPNRAFYLAAVSIGGPAWKIAGTIWYKTLTQRLKGEVDFRKCAYETISVARDFCDNAVASSIAQAWVEVGVIEPNSGSAASLV
jgi:Zn-dependent metalloprotease